MPKALYLEGLLRELGVTDILRIDAPDPPGPRRRAPQCGRAHPRRVAASALDSGAYGRCASGRAFLLEDRSVEGCRRRRQDPWPWRGGQSAGHRLRPAHCTGIEGAGHHPRPLPWPDFRFRRRDFQPLRHPLHPQDPRRSVWPRRFRGRARLRRGGWFLHRNFRERPAVDARRGAWASVPRVPPAGRPATRWSPPPI